MTKIVAFMLSSFLFLTVFSSVATASEPFKVGVIHSASFLDNTKEGQAAIQNIQVYAAQTQKIIDKANSDLLKIKQELDKLAPTLSPANLKLKMDELNRKSAEIDKMTTESQNKVNQMIQEARKKIITKAQVLIAEYAKENGYSMIQDASNVIYSEDEYILTEILVRLYNERY